MQKGDILTLLNSSNKVSPFFFFDLCCTFGLATLEESGTYMNFVMGLARCRVCVA